MKKIAIAGLVCLIILTVAVVWYIMKQEQEKSLAAKRLEFNYNQCLIDADSTMKFVKMYCNNDGLSNDECKKESSYKNAEKAKEDCERYPH